MNYPIDITDKDPSTFSYTPEELGITPFVSTSVKLPIDTDWKECEGELLPIGSQQSIWIGKNATLNLVIGKSNYTTRHEIRSLAFEDGKTSLTENVTLNYIGAHYNYDIPSESSYISSQEQAASDAYNTDYDTWYDAHEAWQAAYDAYEAGTSEEDPGEEPVEPNQDDYTYSKFFNTWDRSTREFIYNQRTINDLYPSSQYFTNPEPLPAWNYNMFISQSLRLPEGITSFGQFSFRHTHFDKNNEYDTHFNNPTDFRIFIPSTVTDFTIFGMVEDRYNYDDPKHDVDDGGSEQNTLYFGEFTNLMNYAVWMGDTEENGYPLNANSTHAEIEEYYQEHDHDTVHIYLRDHTAVPNITFYGGIYFPIVFHVNTDIEAAFRQRYEGSVNFQIRESWDYGDFVTLDYDPVTVVADVGNSVVETSVPLSEVEFSPVVFSGSYDDLTDKPELPDFTELMATISSLQSRVQELENQMVVNSEASNGANDFSEVEPENSSDSVVTDYE